MLKKFTEVRSNQVVSKNALHGGGKRTLCFYHQSLFSIWEQAAFLCEGHI